MILFIVVLAVFIGFDVWIWRSYLRDSYEAPIIVPLTIALGAMYLFINIVIYEALGHHTPVRFVQKMPIETVDIQGKSVDVVFIEPERADSYSNRKMIARMVSEIIDYRPKPDQSLYYVECGDCFICGFYVLTKTYITDKKPEGFIEGKNVETKNK